MRIEVYHCINNKCIQKDECYRYQYLMRSTEQWDDKVKKFKPLVNGKCEKFIQDLMVVKKKKVEKK